VAGARRARGSEAFGDIAAVMKWGVLPSQLAEVLEQGGAIAQRNGLRAAMAAHAGVGIASAVLSGGGADINAVVAALTDWRAMVVGAGGHAVIEWAPLAVKERVEVWDAPGPSRAHHERAQGEARSPRHLNPGRFVGGI
jgi:hypothetical protein